MKIFFKIAIEIVLVCELAVAATPTFDAATSSSTNPPSFSHTTANQPNRIVFCECRYSNATQSISSMTYSGVSMAAVTARQTPGGNNYQEWWYVKNPTTGSNTLSATLSGAMSWIHCTAYTYYNVDQTTPLGTPNKATALSTSVSTSVSSASGELVIDVTDVFLGSSPPAITVGGGQTERFQHNVGADSRAAGSDEPGDTSVTMGGSWSGANYGAVMAVALKPALDQGGAVQYQNKVRAQQ